MRFPDVSQLPAIKDLPDPFVRSDGQRLKDKSEWKAQRDYLKAMLCFYEYGESPSVQANVRVVGATSIITPDGKARKEHVLLSCGPRSNLEFRLDLLVPHNKPGPFPVIVTGEGNIPAIAEEVVASGYALVCFDRTQFAPDNASKQGGVYMLAPAFDGGTLATWAWGYSRVVDYLRTRFDIDGNRIAVVGHSRGGKAALLAGALDERIALTIAVQSGTGGASPYRIGGKNSESLEKITGRFGY